MEMEYAVTPESELADDLTILGIMQEFYDRISQNKEPVDNKDKEYNDYFYGDDEWNLFDKHKKNAHYKDLSGKRKQDYSNMFQSVGDNTDLLEKIEKEDGTINYKPKDPVLHSKPFMLGKGMPAAKLESILK